MTNEQYLVASYFLMAAVSAAAGFVVNRLLRAPLQTLVRAVRSELLPVVRRLCPTGFLLAGIAGFCSVSYPGCLVKTTYAEIVADRSYLVSKTQAQAGAIALYLEWAIMIWCVLVLLMVFKYHQNANLRAGSASPNPGTTALH